MKHHKIYKFLGVVALTVATVTGCAGGDDTAFAKKVMRLMVEGNVSARRMIEWPLFIVLDEPIGAKYMQYKTDEARAEFARSFIMNFSKGFKMKGASFKDFYNWRILKSDDPKMTVVGANAHSDKMLFVFFIAHERWGIKKLAAILVYAQLPSQVSASPASAAGDVTGDVIERKP